MTKVVKYSLLLIVAHHYYLFIMSYQILSNFATHFHSRRKNEIDNLVQKGLNFSQNDRSFNDSDSIDAFSGQLFKPFLESCSEL